MSTFLLPPRPKTLSQKKSRPSEGPGKPASTGGLSPWRQRCWCSGECTFEDHVLKGVLLLQPALDQLQHPEDDRGSDTSAKTPRYGSPNHRLTTGLHATILC